MLALLSGLVAGALHVVSGPDHLAALAPLSALQGRRAWSAGLRWAVGHSAGVAVVGAVCLAARAASAFDPYAPWAERAVGVSLIAVGAWGLRRASGLRVHSHAHEHGPIAHEHLHVHWPAGAGPRAREGRGPHGRHAHAAWALGLLHGSAGGAHVWGVLPALALPGVWSAALYLTGFVLGTCAAMSGFTAALGRWVSRADSPRALARWVQVASLASCVVGLAWIALA